MKKTYKLKSIVNMLQTSIDEAVNFLKENGIEIEPNPDVLISSKILTLFQNDFESFRKKKPTQKNIENKDSKQILKELKVFWKVDELKFIAKFHRPKKEDGSYIGDFGFFNHFVNYETGKPIYYPRPDNVDDFNTRISFKQNMVDGLIDGDFYYLQLEYDNKSRNTYHLRIINVEGLDQEQTKKDLEALKNKNKLKDDILNSIMEDNSIKENLFYGQYKSLDSGDGFLKKIISVDEGNLLLYGGRRQDIFISKKVMRLEDKVYYEFRVLSVKKKDDKLYFFIDTKNPPQKLKTNPYKETIRLRYERLDNPESNKMIANLMREIGKGLYSSKQRMIFELLQNADDAPADESVQFHIDVSDDYFFVMHNGVPFNKDDVEAITSAAESTKRNDKKKTGYKGIGFKSVFTDSEEVIINSGGFSFAFQKLNPAFQSFEDFYFNKDRYKKYPELLEEDKLKFKKQRLHFNGVRDIPWQVVPIWQDDIPEQINNTNFAQYDNNVKFAIKFGADKIPGYLKAIEDFTSTPHFILFLRNTTYFRSPKNGITIQKIGKNPVIIKRSTSKKQKIELSYFKNDIENIPVTNESFKDLGIDILKNKRENDYGEVTYFFENSRGIELDNIPPKLASMDDTQITFALPIEDEAIIAEKKYLKGIPYSSLFTYLPMEETRFQLPFLINADFVPSSDRESIQGDNPWNIYIMAKIAEHHVIMIESFASKFLENNKLYKKYLSLLLKDLISDDNTAQEIIDIYNKNYYKKLENTNIIVADNKQIILLKETIIDSSGITKIFENELFYKIINTDKRLPHKDLTSKYLKYKYLEIEKVDLEDLISEMDDSKLELFAEAVPKLTNLKYNDLLTWLDKVAALGNFADGKFGDIPFIKHDDKIYSINELLDLDDAWVINEKTIEIEEILSNLGFDIIDLDLENNSSIDYYIKSNINYTNNTDLAYSRISENSSLKDLCPKDKANLLTYFESSDFMKGIGETRFIDTLELFKNLHDLPCPLSQLIAPTERVLESTLKNFTLLSEEFETLDLRFQNKVIMENDIFTKFFLNNDLYNEWSKQFNAIKIDKHVSELKYWYDKLENKNNISQSDWDNIAWLYISNKDIFKKSEEVYCPESLYNLKKDNYNIVASTLNTDYYVPHYKSSELVEYFGLACETGCISMKLIVLNNFTLLDANTFLDWLEDNNETGFFDNWKFIKKEKNIFNIKENFEKIYNSSRSIGDYIQNDKNLKEIFFPLPVEICSETRNKIGLLQGEALLIEIIRTKKYKQDLVKYFTEDFPDQYFKLYIENLESFNLDSTTNYDKSSPENKVVSKLLEYIKDEDNISREIYDLIDDFRDKIYINNNHISEHNIVDKVSFRIEGKTYNKLRLSEILPDFKGNTDVLTEIIDSFIGIGLKVQLQKEIFKTELMSYSKIYNLIKENIETFLTPHQLVFMFLYRKFEMIHSGKEIGFPKDMFDDYYDKINDNQGVFDGYKTILDLLFELEFYDMEGFKFLNTDLENLVLSETKLKEEEITIWLQEWINKEGSQDRIDFLSKLGLNTKNSAVVKYREAMVANIFDIDIVNKYYSSVKENETLLWNSIIWLSKYSSDIISRNIEIIKKTLAIVDLEENSEVIIPVIDEISEEKKYILVEITKDDSVHYIQASWKEHTKEIFSTLRNEGSHITDQNCSDNFKKYLNYHEVDPVTVINRNLLRSNSVIFDELFYKKWEYYSQYRIYIYKDLELPKILTYDELEVKKFLSGKMYFLDGVYYVTKDLKDDILANLPQDFPQDKLLNLKEWERRTLKDSSLLDDYDYGYNESIERILRDKFGLNESDQRSKSQESKAAAIYFLEEQGYDLSGVENKGYKIEGLIDPYGCAKECVVRSAEGGLMYIDEYHWAELKNENVFLLTMYPGGSAHIFNTQQELLNEELNKYLLFRINNSRNPEDIEKVFKQLNKENSHLMMVTNQEMKIKLYEQFSSSKNKASVPRTGIADDNFDF